MILDRHPDFRDIVREDDPGGAAARVAMNVVQSLLHHAKQRHLDLARQPAEIWRHRQIHLDTAPLRKSCHVQAQSGRETVLLELGRMQQVRRSAKIAYALLRQVQALIQGAARAVVKVLRGFAHDFEIHAKRGDVLRGAVMKLASQPAALVILQPHQLGGQLAQRGLGALTLGDVFHQGDDLRWLSRSTIEPGHAVTRPYDIAILADITLLAYDARRLPRHELIPKPDIFRSIVRMGDREKVQLRKFRLTVTGDFTIRRVYLDQTPVRSRDGHAGSRVCKCVTQALFGGAESIEYPSTLAHVEHVADP